MGHRLEGAGAPSPGKGERGRASATAPLPLRRDVFATERGCYEPASIQGPDCTGRWAGDRSWTVIDTMARWAEHLASTPRDPGSNPGGDRFFSRKGRVDGNSM